MSDQVDDDADVDRLVEEIRRLRGQVAQLQERVEQLDQLAHQDSLIDLPNRRGFLRELERLIARVEPLRHQGRHAVRRRRRVEDDQRHVRPPRRRRGADPGRGPAGAAAFARATSCARIGGDEFGILLENADEKSAHETAARLVDLIAGCEFLHEGDALPLSVAIGVGMIEASDTARERSWLARTRKCTAARLRPKPRRGNSAARPTGRPQGRRRSACRSGSPGRRSHRRRYPRDI